MEASTRKMESVNPSECDRASEMSFCLEDDIPPETVLNTEEAEELTQSLKEIVDTEDVKPKLQCLMSNPCFSMVTVQCEDSGIFWETSSSRCSTPWASEASTTSDVYSMESSSAGSLPGKVIFIMDDGKLRRKKARTSSDLSRQSSRLKRNVDQQKSKSKENMEETFKQALEKAKCHSFSQTGKTNNNHVSTEPPEVHTTQSKLGSKSSLESAVTKGNTDSINVDISYTLPEQEAEPLICCNTRADRPDLISSMNGGQSETIEKNGQEATMQLPIASNGIKFGPNIVDLNVLPNTANLNSLNETHLENMVSPLDDKLNKLSTQSPEISSPPLNQVERVSLHTINEETEQVLSSSSYSSHEDKLIESQPSIVQSPSAIAEKSDIISSPLTDTLKQDAFQASVQDTFSDHDTDIKKSLLSPTEAPTYEDVKSVISPNNEVPKLQKTEFLLNDTADSTLKQSDLQNVTERKAQFSTYNIHESKIETNNIGAGIDELEKEKHVEPLQEMQNVDARTDHNKGVSTIPKHTSNKTVSLNDNKECTYLTNLHISQEINSEENNECSEESHDCESDVFGIISDGSENIGTLQRLSSANQDSSNQLLDKLEYLNQKEKNDNTTIKNPSTVNISEDVNQNGASKQIKEEKCAKNTNLENIKQTNPDKGITDVDYFEKFTLIDDKIPIDPHFEKSSQKHEISQTNGIKVTEQETAVEDDYCLLGHVDEFFYGVNDVYGELTSEGKTFFNQESDPSTAEHNRAQDNDLKATGVELFNAEESVLIKSCFFPVSYKIINPELLEEPPALAFLYTDLYEQATGAKAKTENDQSDEDSTGSVATFHSRISDDDGTGIYFEKYILKDEIPVNETNGSIHSANVAVKKVAHETEGKVLSYVDGCTFELPDFKKREQEKKEHEAINKKQEVTDSVSTKYSHMNLAESDLDTFQTDTNEDKCITHVSPTGKNGQTSQNFIEDQPLPVLKDHINEIMPKVQVEHMHKEEKMDDKDELLVGSIKSPTAPCETVPDPQKPSTETVIHDEMEELCLEDIEAESLDYVVISQEDLQDVTSQEELRFEDKEHDSDGGYEFFTDAEQEVAQDYDDSGFEMIEHVKSPSELSETSQTDDKKGQIDTYCHTCKIPILAIDKVFGGHKNHDVTTLENTVNEMTENLEDLLEKLKESSIKTEDFVSTVEALFNEVEKNCKETEKILQERNEKMIEKVVAQHNGKRESFEEVKKMKMEYLYDQMVSFQQNVDTAKAVLEKTVKDMEELDPVAFLSSHDEINNRLLSALENTLSLEKMPSAFSLFEHYAGNSSRGDQKMQKHVPVPQTPKLKAQEPNSATSNSITVYWTMSKDDVIDCFQVYCMEEPQGNRDDSGLLEEYRVTVKESFCILEDLEPDKCYSVWVMAVNYTGCSLPSDKTAFRTAPSTPVIKAEECTVCWNKAIIRWSTTHPETTETFTLEWCRQYPSEGEGLRSVAGVKDQQLKVPLLPNENYFFYVRAANTFGTSEQSEAALISTKGTRFHLLKDTAHPAIDISPDGNVISITEHSKITGIPLVLGELLPASGQHYWEMMVNECKAFSIGATFQPSQEEQNFAEDSTSWCMQCCCTPTSLSYKFLHNEVLSEVLLTEPLVRVGILLDYKVGRLSFFNVQRGHLLFTFRHKYTEAAHPTFALETPGELHLHAGMELPQFAKRS